MLIVQLLGTIFSRGLIQYLLLWFVGFQHPSPGCPMNLSGREMIEKLNSELQHLLQLLLSFYYKTSFSQKLYKHINYLHAHLSVMMNILM